jgi:AcrR family transcriptional regulator
MPPQVVFRPKAQPSVAPGLRSRKKTKTRLTIEDAALALFDEQGYESTTVEEIAERAEVSTTTFFRYFPSKAEVLLSDHGQQLPALHQAILDRPMTESDLVAVQHAVQQEWVTAIDTARTARKSQMIATTPVLQGLSYQRGLRWFAVVNDALARRRGLEVPDERCTLAARVMLGVLGCAVEGWIAGRCRGDLAEAVDQRFDQMTELGREWSQPRTSEEEMTDV